MEDDMSDQDSYNGSYNGSDGESYKKSNDIKISLEKKENNFKCLKCYHKFYINLKENILCPNCGYRILDKLRTKKHIIYKTE